MRIHTIRRYGSGYPGYSTVGVSQRGLPYYFWPIVWSSRPTPYYEVENEVRSQHPETKVLCSSCRVIQYGAPTNTSRPGGALVEAAFFSNASEAVQFRLLGDNVTVSALIPLIQYNCSMINNSTSSSSAFLYASNSTFNSSSPSDAISYPRPEQAIQYYRASTLVLTMDGYNDSSVFSTTSATSNSTATGSQTPLPSLGSMDQLFMTCLNDTIGQAVPLVDAAYSIRLGGGMSLNIMLAIWVFACLRQWFRFL